MLRNTFTFKGKNCSDFHIQMNHYDVLMPERRNNTVSVPSSSRHIDVGGAWYNQRPITVTCSILYPMTKAETREIAYWLSGEGKLVFYDEPDKYYRAKIYAAPPMTVFSQEVGREFELLFVADPFAYGAFTEVDLATGENKISYSGTAECPTRIIIENNTDVAVNGIIIETIRRVD